MGWVDEWIDRWMDKWTEEWMEKCDVGVSQVCLALHNPLFDFLDPTMLAIGVSIWHSEDRSLCQSNPLSLRAVLYV